MTICVSLENAAVNLEAVEKYEFKEVISVRSTNANLSTRLLPSTAISLAAPTFTGYLNFYVPQILTCTPFLFTQRCLAINPSLPDTSPAFILPFVSTVSHALPY